MEFRRRSLWNRVWDGERLDAMGHEEYARRIYEGEGESQTDQWREMGYGLVLSAWKGVQWAWSGFGLHWMWHNKRRMNDEYEREEDTV